MSFNYTERRKHQRIHVERAIFVEVDSPGSRTEAHNQILRCETLDVSVSGLRIWVPEEIMEGSKLNIAAPMEDWKENLELVGQAIWVRPAEDQEGFWVGLELADSSRADMEKWLKVVYRLAK